MTHVQLWAGLLGCAALSLPTAAHAFCRTTTEPRAAGMCPEACITTGFKLYWGVPNPRYTLNERGFPDLDDTQVRAVLARSFGHWNDVTCATPEGDQPVGLDIQAAPGTTSLEVGPDTQEPNANVIVYFGKDEWLDQGLSADAYALTAIWYNKNNGEILGADMHYNGGMGRLVECPDTGCEDGDVDLENVTTHEAGHFVGLAHSSTPGSTMWCSAESFETEKRSLAADDIAGLCEIYPPGEAFPSADDDDDDSGCSTSGGSRTGAGAALSLFGLAALLLRRRRRA